MGNIKIETLHRGAFTFESSTSKNHSWFMDADEDLGGNDYGPTPVETLLASLNSCLGICIVNILNKKNIAYHDFNISNSATQTNNPPKVLEKIELNFSISINEGDRETFESIVRQAHERYCIISLLLKQSVTIENYFEYN